MRSPEDYESYVNNGVDIIRLWELWLTEDLIEKVISTGCKVWIMARDPDLGGTDIQGRELIYGKGMIEFLLMTKRHKVIGNRKE